jgi:Cys-Gly metallodipeptidase DUG1
VGRGSSDDKGPVLGWLGVLQWHYEHKKEIPVNLVICFHRMEENGSEGLERWWRGRRMRGLKVWIVFIS